MYIITLLTTDLTQSTYFFFINLIFGNKKMTIPCSNSSPWIIKSLRNLIQFPVRLIKWIQSTFSRVKNWVFHTEINTPEIPLNKREVVTDSPPKQNTSSTPLQQVQRENLDEICLQAVHSSKTVMDQEIHPEINTPEIPLNKQEVVTEPPPEQNILSTLLQQVQRKNPDEVRLQAIRSLQTVMNEKTVTVEALEANILPALLTATEDPHFEVSLCALQMIKPLTTKDNTRGVKKESREKSFWALLKWVENKIATSPPQNFSETTKTIFLDTPHLLTEWIENESTTQEQWKQSIIPVFEKLVNLKQYEAPMVVTIVNIINQCVEEKKIEKTIVNEQMIPFLQDLLRNNFDSGRPHCPFTASTLRKCKSYSQNS